MPSDYGSPNRRDSLLGRKGYIEHPTAAPLLAMGLVSAINHANEEQDLPRRDHFLDELRSLTQAHPQDAAVREQLAEGLVTVLNDAKAEQDLLRRDHLLSELRAVAQPHPEDAAGREQLAKALNDPLKRPFCP